MNALRSEFLKILDERGFIQQSSDFAGVDASPPQGRLTTYVGYDCTGPSLHVGHLLSIMMLHWLQKTGAGKPISLMGGGTTRVGDPSGKDESRKLMTVEKIEANKACIKRVFSRFLASATASRCHDDRQCRMAAQLNYIEFLATWAVTSRSTACCPSTASSSGWTASTSCHSWNSTT